MGLRKTSRDAAHRATTRGGLPPQAFVRTQSLSSKMTANLDWRDKFVPTEVSEAPQGSPKKKVFNMRAPSGGEEDDLGVPSGAAATLGDPSKEGESRRMACNLANASEEAARRHALWSERSHTHLRSSLDSRLGKSPKRVVSQQAA